MYLELYLSILCHGISMLFVSVETIITGSTLTGSYKITKGLHTWEPFCNSILLSLFTTLAFGVSCCPHPSPRPPLHLTGTPPAAEDKLCLVWSAHPMWTPPEWSQPWATYPWSVQVQEVCHWIQPWCQTRSTSPIYIWASYLLPRSCIFDTTPEAVVRKAPAPPVSYTHLTLPTICSV